MFLHEKMKALILTLLTRFARPEIWENHSTTKKLMNIDLSKNENLLSEEFVKVGLEAKKFQQITQSFKLLANLKKQAR